MDYWVYYFNDKGHIAKRLPLQCSDDDEAMAMARRFGLDVEVWQLARLVAKIDNKGTILPLKR